jgi:predicted solute-binding protein
MKSRLAVPDVLFTKPLFFALEGADSPFELVPDSPAKNSLKFSGRSEEIRGAFLSPIDYARHGAEYCIVPGVCVSSAQPSGAIRLFLKKNLRNIERIGIDIRFTSEIILAKIILEEKYRNLPSDRSKLQFLPILQNDPFSALDKVDAVLTVSTSLPVAVDRDDVFSIDLVEEWKDLTDLPYVHGFWVGREEEMNESEILSLLHAGQQGNTLKGKITEDHARKNGLPLQAVKDYIAAFSYSIGEEEEAAMDEFVRYAYYHGVIGDIPDVRYFDLPAPEEPAVH